MKEKLYDFPPYAYLEQVAIHCPKAVATYMHIWRKMDRMNRLHLEKKSIPRDFLKSVVRFKNDILLLVGEGLVSMNETLNMIHLEIVGWGYIEMDEKLCL